MVGRGREGGWSGVHKSTHNVGEGGGVGGGAEEGRGDGAVSKKVPTMAVQ